MRKDPNFGFEVPIKIEGIDQNLLNPKESWKDKIAYTHQANKLVKMFIDNLMSGDPEFAEAIQHELFRQQDQLEMIASENIVSSSVLEAQGSILTNKYAEGYSGKRYYGGCEYIDVVETLAIERAK